MNFYFFIHSIQETNFDEKQNVAFSLTAIDSSHRMKCFIFSFFLYVSKKDKNAVGQKCHVEYFAEK